MRRRRGKQGDVRRIAIVGADASGKTTLLRELEKKLGKEREYGFYQSSGFAKHGKLFRLLGKFFDKLSRNKKTTPRFAAHAGYAVTTSFARMVKEKDKRVVFFDRYAPLDVSAFREMYRVKKKTRLLPFFRFLTGTRDPDVVVLMKLPLEEAISRIGRRKTKQAHESREMLERMQRAYDEEVEKLRSKGVKVIELDSSKLTPEQEARIVLRELKRQV